MRSSTGTAMDGYGKEVSTYKLQRSYKQLS
jgi:hypothetical protein